jgi:hypothetical protein
MSTGGSGGGSGSPGNGEKLTPQQLAAITAAATGLVGGIGALTLTGALGRVQRNHGPWFAVAVGLVLLGAAVFVGASMIEPQARASFPFEFNSMPKSGRRTKRLQKRTTAQRKVGGVFFLGGLIGLVAALLVVIMTTKHGWHNAGRITKEILRAGKYIFVAITSLALVTGFLLLVASALKVKRGKDYEIKLQEAVKAFGTLLLAIGLILGFAVAISSAGQTEQPAVALSLNSDGSAVSGTAKVGDLSSRSRMTVYIDGLTLRGNVYNPTHLYTAYIGPNGDGNATDNITVRVPPNEFDAVRLRAFTATNPTDCGKYPTVLQNYQGTGCVIIAIPNRPAAPELAASWERSDIVNITMKSDIARLSSTGSAVLLQVAGRSGKASRTPNVLPLYNAVVQATSSTITRSVRLPLVSNLTMVCIDAQYVSSTAEPPVHVDCPIPHRKHHPLTTQKDPPDGFVSVLCFLGFCGQPAPQHSRSIIDLVPATSATSANPPPENEG